MEHDPWKSQLGINTGIFVAVTKPKPLKPKYDLNRLSMLAHLAYLNSKAEKWKISHTRRED